MLEDYVVKYNLFYFYEGYDYMLKKTVMSASVILSATAIWLSASNAADVYEIQAIQPVPVKVSISIENAKVITPSEEKARKEEAERLKQEQIEKEQEEKQKIEITEQEQNIQQTNDETEEVEETQNTEQVAKLYTLERFMFQGVINWGGYKFTYYSQSVLPGGALVIPGRHVNADGYVSDGEGYIVLAGDAPKGTIYPTPFGYYGKIYDRGTVGNHLDVYIR